MCVRLCWLLVGFASSMDEASDRARARRAINWFHDHFRVVATGVDREKDTISIQMPWVDMVRMAEDLYLQQQETDLRCQHEGLAELYDSYQTLLNLLKN